MPRPKRPHFREEEDALFDDALPIVAIVGRPNVGKSTFFNRITGKRRAAVYDSPGITRDRNLGIGEWGGRRFRLIDTGGFELDPQRGHKDADKKDDRAEHLPLLAEIREQAKIAIEQADVVILMVEVDADENPTDAELVDLLRRSEKPFVLGVNKCEKDDEILQAWDFARLGVGDLYAISALHGVGNADMLDHVISLLPPPKEGEIPDDEEFEEGDEETRLERRLRVLEKRAIRLAIVGRQNVGKSTLANQLLGEERMIAADLPGTTRDAIDAPLRALDRDWVLIDTAGIRRRGKIGGGIEGLSAMSSLMSMDRADIVIMLIDANTGMTAQDKHILGYAIERGCCLVIGVNKWDAYEDKDHRSADEMTKKIREESPFAAYAPIVYCSALTGQRATKLLEVALDVFHEGSRHIRTHDLMEWIDGATRAFPPPVRQNRKLAIKYVAQTGLLPPTFTLFCNYPKAVHFSYERYLINNLRERFGFKKVPVRLKLRAKKSEKREFPNYFESRKKKGKG